MDEELRGSTYTEWRTVSQFAEDYGQRYGERIKAIVVYGRLAENAPFPLHGDVHVLAVIEGYEGPRHVQYPMIASPPQRPRFLWVWILTPEEFQEGAERGDPRLVRVSETYSIGWQYYPGYVDETLWQSRANQTRDPMFETIPT
jgi:hypothetical protein